MSDFYDISGDSSIAEFSECRFVARSVDVDKQILLTTIKAWIRAGSTERLPSSVELAEWLCLSPRTLSRRLRNAGKTYRGLISEVKCQMAQELLLSSDCPVSDVAERVGYRDLSNFTKAFKNWSGMTPREYRRERRSVNLK